LSIYLGEEIAEEVEVEMKRLDRPRSWLIQQAWRNARATIKAMPGR
jgi:uncharacterized small protein (TIGR04563 family)